MPLGETRIEQMAVADLHLVLHVQLVEPMVDVRGLGVLAVAAQQLGEQVKIGEHAGEQVTISEPVTRADDLAVDQDRTR